MSLRFVSLFSGCGGLDLGFIQAGFTCVSAYDLDRDAVRTYKSNIGNHIEIRDLSGIDPEIVEKIRSVDVLVAGPPCQGFSTAGKNDPHDARNSLLLNVANLVAMALPRVVVIENVRGLLGARYSTYLNRLVSTLTDSGYKVSYKLVEASSFGVAQRRKRVIIVATLGGAELELTFPDEPLKDLDTVLADVALLNQHNVCQLSQESDALKISKHIAPGQKLSNVRGGKPSVHTWSIPEVFGETTAEERILLETILQLRRQKRRRPTGDADPVSVADISMAIGYEAESRLQELISKGYARKIGDYYDITNTFNGKFRRLRGDELAPTVDTRFGEARYFLHPREHRGFTVREAARIQGFPDDFCFDLPQKAAFRLIGNAVPPPMAKAIASLIREKVFDGNAGTI